MAYIGTVLGWKFNHEPGITTVDGVIKEWPKVLGPLPTKEQLELWSAEYDFAQVAIVQAEAAEKAKKEQAAKDLKDLIIAQSADETKITLKDLIDRVKEIEKYLGF